MWGCEGRVEGVVRVFYVKYLLETVIILIVRFDPNNKINKRDTTHYTLTPWFKIKLKSLYFFQSAATKRIKAIACTCE